MRVDPDDGGIQVMEHREPPRIAAGDRRFDGAIEEPRGRDSGCARSTRSAIDVALTSSEPALMVAGGARRSRRCSFYLGSRATIAAVAWLHRQSQYQLAFDEIQLAHELPSWYRGGNREFLDRVRRGSGQSERHFSTGGRPDRLAVAFKLDPWVEEVVKVSYAPGRISVDLKFREPVAWVKLDGGAAARRWRGPAAAGGRRGYRAAGPVAQDHGQELDSAGRSPSRRRLEVEVRIGRGRAG